MLKISSFSGESEHGPVVVPLFTTAGGDREKVASAELLPDVARYISSLRPRPDAQYVLVNALGAGEYYSSNINGDYFSEASLIHRPDEWSGNPLLDKLRSKDWPWGFPTFYYAHPYAHHKNKDSSRAYGEVELASWNDRMKRVELVTRVDKDKCLEFGGVGVWDKLQAGMYVDVSMGCAPAGTRILQADGRQKQIEDVQVGDMVLSHRGRAQRVETVMRRHYNGTIYRFKVYGFRRELSVTDEHPLWLVRAEELLCKPSPSQGNKGRRQRHCTPLIKGLSKGCLGCGTEPKYDFDWVRADQAEVGDCLAFPVPQHLDRTIQSLDEARFLGFYLAEGFVQNYNNRPLEQITFCLNLMEKELAEEIESIGRRLGAKIVWHNEQPDKGGRYVHVIHKDLAARCLAFCGKYAKEKVVSREVLYMSTDLQIAFLGAYLDGDGGTYKGAAYFSTSSEQLADQLFVMLARCGIIAGINEIEHHPSEKSVVRKDTTEYQVWVGKDFSTRLGPHTRKTVYPSLKLRGQRFFYVNDDGSVYLMAPITEIEEEDFDNDVFNFSVNEDDSYVAEFLATHNCKVPFDLCSVCTDWKMYREAQATFDSKKHRSPGEAVLAVHRSTQKLEKDKDDKPVWTGKGKIRGLSVTRKDYCEHALNRMNHILPDGRKIFVYNDYPRFFDISFVFIGADKTAKVMMKIASAVVPGDITSTVQAEKLGYRDGDEMDKAAASPEDAVLEAAFGKRATLKQGEIVKDVVPSQFAGKAVPVLTASEPDLPNDVIETLAKVPIETALSTTGGLGMVLRPREFQRIILISIGKRDTADDFDRHGIVFPRSDEHAPMELGPSSFLAPLAKLLLPLFNSRSALAPAIEKRVLISDSKTQKEKKGSSSLSSELLRKMGAGYNTYREQLMNLAAHAQPLLEQTAYQPDLQKLSSASAEEVFSPLSVAYIKLAFMDELGERRENGLNASLASARRGEGIPLEEHVKLF